MPTERFYRLSEEKKKVIRDAAFHEFARVPFDKASINQIIKEADISRGSFYTYFEDKWDVLNYIFEENQKGVRDKIYRRLEETEGDIWEMLDCFLDCALEFCNREEDQQFARNVMIHTNSENVFGSFKKKSHPAESLGEEAVRWIYTRYSREKMREMGYREFTAFFQLSIFSVAIEIKNYFEGKTLSEIHENFRLKMELLKRGVSPSCDVLVNVS